MRRKLGVLFAFVITLAVVATTIGARPNPAGAAADDDTRIARGLAIAPVPLDMTGRNPRQVARGSYLVNAAGGCNDCHSCPSYAPGHNPFDGIGDGAINAENYLAGGVDFGIAVSRNLTPDASGLPAGLTEDEFMSAIRTGHDPKSPGYVLQVMPWPVFRNQIDTDLDAIYQYLSSIPPAEPGECFGPGQ